MLTQDFCNYLEYQVSAALATSSDPTKLGWWCDGILLPAATDAYAPQRINSTKQVVTRAWLGKTGQEPYDMTIRFGPKAVRQYMRGNALEECVPSPENANWIGLDERTKAAVIDLL